MAQRGQRIDAFTIRHSSRVNRIITDVQIQPASDPSNAPSDPSIHHDTQALWDTGASRSVITQSVADALGLVKTGEVKVAHAGGTSVAPTYIVNILLPNHVGVAGVLVTGCAGLPHNVGALIGMDIITMGDFAITNSRGSTAMSYCTPSTKDIDFVAEIDTMKRRELPAANRNDPCPCGKKQPDGRPVKFKHCCGRGR